jgi:hypothetical protein
VRWPSSLRALFVSEKRPARVTLCSSCESAPLTKPVSSSVGELNNANAIQEKYPSPEGLFGVAICVGPGDLERSRFEDFADSLFHYEPGVARLAVVDDSLDSRQLLSRLKLPAQCKATVISNPRKGRGSGWGAGLTAAILSALRWLHDNGPLSFVLKADTDTLIVAPFASKIHTEFLARPSVGMMGSCRKWPDRPRDFFSERSIAPAMEKLLRQVTIWRRTYDKWPRLQLGCFGKYGRIRAILRQALLNGYILGENCLGGGYAISGATLAEMSEAGLLDEPMLWINTPCSEDVVISLYVKRVCKDFADFNGIGEPFGVSVKASPFSPEEVIKRGYSIVHSVCSCNGCKESEVRSFFSSLRHAGGSGLGG